MADEKYPRARSVERIIAPQETHWVGDGFRVHNFFPHGLQEQRMSPFYLLDYNSNYYFAPSDIPRGVGPHPHRGFETVTIAFKGKVAHHDSRGNSGVIGEGDVQWMTAGSGILHKEHHEETFSKAGGDFHMLQLWVNLPEKNKMTEPKYQAIQNQQMGKFNVPGDLGVIDVIAGDYGGVKGPASTFTPIHIYVARVKNGSKLKFSTPSNYNTGLVNLEGALRINDRNEVPLENFVLFANDGGEFTVEAMENSMYFILSGEPLNEPIAAYGPFVMNTQEEISQAVSDFSRGRFGYLAD